jgi:iron complex transport system ATP-binding protein
VLTFSDVAVGYGTEIVVENVNFTLKRGQILGVIGPNGSGKSTIARTLYNQADILSGKVEFREKDITSYSPAQRARHIGILPQSIVAPFTMTASEFVRLGSIEALIGTSDALLDGDVVRALESTNSEYLATKPITQLSGGELQRLYFAQALVNDPDLLVLDEPTSHLDINHRLHMLDTVQTLVRKAGKAAFVIFHDFDLAARYADELIVVSARAISSPELPAADCASQVHPPRSPAEVLTPEMFRSVFGVEASVEGGKIVFLHRVMC